MKTAIKIVFLLLTSLCFFTQTFSDDPNPITGTWKGKFMDQFDLEMILEVNEGNQFSGRLVMYDGNQQIQNDQLSDIKIAGPQLFFTIPAKNTDFEGTWDMENNRIEGYFIFPDLSKHPLKLVKFKVSSDQDREISVNDLELLHRQFSYEQLKEDLNYLKNNLESTHPQLYRFTDKSELNKLFMKSNELLNVGLNTLEFYQLIAPIVEKVKCSHTGIRFSDQYQTTLEESGNYLPLEIRFIGEQSFCISSFPKENNILQGSEILSINGKEISEIREIIFSWIPADGHNVSSKYFEINRNFNSYFRLLDNSTQFDITYKPADYGNLSHFQINAVSSQQIENFKDNKNGMEQKSESLSYSNMEELSLGMLRIPTFGISDIDGYLTQLDQIFSEVNQRKFKNLVLDVRGNRGGHPIFAAILLSYLAEDSFVYFENKNRADEFEPLYREMSPNEKAFSGNCYVLVDGGVLSTTGHLVSLLKYHNLVKFVGEEPGSSFYCNDMSTQIRLPHTGIIANIPQMIFMTDVSGFKYGEKFNVDFPIAMDLPDLVSGKDTQLEFILRRIKEENQL